MTDMMADVIKRGTGIRARSLRPATTLQARPADDEAKDTLV